MTELTKPTFKEGSESEFGTQRRNLLKGAAWAAPAVALAAATPFAAASVNNASLTWNPRTTGLIDLSVIQGSNTLGVELLFTRPNNFTLYNGTGPIKDTATVQITVNRPDGLSGFLNNILSLGKARGLGVAKFNGVNVASGSNEYEYEGVLIKRGFPTTTFTTTLDVDLASEDNLRVPVEWGLIGERGILNQIIDANLLVSFEAVISFTIGGRTFTDTSTLTIPARVGVL